MKHSLLILLAVIANVFILKAQFIITSDTGIELSVCADSQEIEIELIASSPYTGSIELALQFPPGVAIVPDSEAVQSDAIESFESNLADPQNPVFSLQTDASGLSTSDVLLLSFRKAINCESIQFVQGGGVLEDIVSVSYEGGEDEDFTPAYQILYGSLSIPIPEVTNFEHGSEGTQTIQIQNGGLACVDSLLFEQSIPSSDMQLLDVRLQGASLSVTENNGWLQVPISAAQMEAAGLGSCLEIGENLEIDLIWTSELCSSIESIDFENRVSWGCEGEQCNPTQSTDSSIFLTSPELSNDVIFDYHVDRIGNCERWQHVYTLRDPGTPSNAVVDLERIRIGHGTNLASFRPEYYLIESITLNGAPASWSTQGLGYDGQAAGLQDPDGDGTYTTMVPDEDYVLRFQTYVPFDLQELSQNIDSEVRSLIDTRLACTGQLSSDAYEAVETSFVREIDVEVEPCPNVAFQGEELDFSIQYEYLSERECSLDSMVVQLAFADGIELATSTSPITDALGLPLEHTEPDESGFVYVYGIDSEVQTINVKVFIACGSEALLTEYISVDIKHYCNEGCEEFDIIEGTYCRLTVFDVLCDGDVIGQGGNVCGWPLHFDAYRTSFGWTDSTMTQKVSGADPGIALHRAVEGDTVLVTSTLRLSDLEDNRLIIGHRSQGLQPTFDYLSTDAYDLDGNFICSPSAEWEFEYGTGIYEHHLRYNNADPLACPGLLENLIELRILLRVTSALVTDAPTLVEPFFLKFDCDGSQIKALLPPFACLNTSMSVGVSPPAIEQTVCEDIFFSLSYTFSVRHPGDPFPFEYRPLFKFHKISTFMPDAVSAIKLRDGFLGFEGHPFEVEGPGSIPEPAFSWDKETVWTDFPTDEIPDVQSSSENSGSLTIRTIRIDNVLGCGPVPEGNSGLVTVEYFPRYIFGDTAEMDTLSVFVDITPLNDWNNVVLQGHTQLDAGEASFEVPIITCSELFSIGDQGQNPFLIVPAPLEDDLLHFFPNDTESINEDGSKIYDIGGPEGLLCFGELNVPFEYLYCDAGEQTLLLGYSCNETVTGIEDMCGLADLIITVDPVDAEVQYLAEEIPAQALCDTIDMVLKVASSRQGTIMNPEIKIDLPLQGINLLSSARLEYPLGSSLRSFSIDNSSNTTTIDLAAADLASGGDGLLASSGIKGLINSTADQRQARVHLQFMTDCDFVAGSQGRLQVSADRFCGEAAIGSGITVPLQPVSIQGVQALSSTICNIEQTSLDYCSQTATVQAEVSFLEYSPESQNLQCNITLPEFVQYLEGSLETSVSEGDFVLNQFGDFQQLSLELTQGLAAGQTFTVEFAVDLSGLLCSDTVQELVYSLNTTEQAEAVCLLGQSNCLLAVQNNLETCLLSTSYQGLNTQIDVSAQLSCVEDQLLLQAQVLLENFDSFAFESEELVLAVYLDTNASGGIEESDEQLAAISLSSLQTNETGQLVSEIEEELQSFPQSLLVQILQTDSECSLDCSQEGTQVQLEYESTPLHVGSVWLDLNEDGVQNEDPEDLPLYQGTLNILQDGQLVTQTSVVDGAYQWVPTGPGVYEIEFADGAFIWGDGSTYEPAVVLDDLSSQFAVSGCGDDSQLITPATINCSLDLLDFDFGCLNEGAENVYTLIVGDYYLPLSIYANGQLIGEQDESVFNLEVPAGELLDVSVVDAAGCNFELELPCHALPLELFSFDAVALQEHNLISWQIAEDRNVSAYHLYRSFESGAFSKIAEIAAKDFPNEIGKYEFRDLDVQSGTSYYKLIIERKDGISEESAIVQLHRAMKQQLVLIYPQPAEQTLHLQLSDDFLMQIYAANGELLMRQELAVGIQSISVSHLPPSVYLLQLTNAGQSLSKKVFLGARK